MRLSEIVPKNCATCPRLVKWRAQVACPEGWAKPVPGFGGIGAKIMMVGLAPSRLGANRTGRMFTGDQTGKWLYARLYEAGLANQAKSESLADGLNLPLVYLTTVVKCVPPQNKPLAEEVAACSPYLEQELEILPHIQVLLAFGQLAFLSLCKLLRLKASFRHGFEISGDWRGRSLSLLASYHPSPQNTQTGRFTKQQGHLIFLRAKELLNP
jgi:uracil-DNA glycosylase